MAEKFNWKGLAGTAKKWLDQKTTEMVTTDRRTRESAEHQADRLEQQMTDEVGSAALTTMFPSLGRAIERQEANRRRAAQDDLDRARARRAAAVVQGAAIELSGAVHGRVDDVAVTLTPDDEEGTLTVLLEPVEPVPLPGGTLAQAGFAISGFRGDGRYALEEDIPSLEPGVHHVALVGDGEDCWFYWVSEYGRGDAVVQQNTIVATMVCDNAGSQRITATLTVPLH
jgi:hypothetical protein